MIIDLKINPKEEAILILAHEFIHYLLVLNGSLLPVELEGNVSRDAEPLASILMKSITHHFLLRQELHSASFEELQLRYALNDQLQEMLFGFIYEEKFWLLELYDRSTFAENYDFDSLRERFELNEIGSVYELLQSSPKETIEDINEISRSLIREFNCESSLELQDINKFTSR